jgi:hypothetical protein
MSLIKDTWGQLVRHRLWPIALGLVAAMVAVPMLLAKDPAPAPAPAPSAAAPATADDAALEPVVAQADATQAVRRRHVLGVRKDPFKPAPQPKVKVTKVTDTTTGGPGIAGAGAGGGVGGPTAGGGAPSIVAPSTPVAGGPVGGGAPAPERKPAKVYPTDSLTVRFGAGEGDAKSLLETGQALPEAADGEVAPLLVYLGLSKDGKRARFLVDASVKADGDGHCVSDDATGGCETLEMGVGDTEFLDVADDQGAVGEQYELDVLAIHTKKGAKAGAARKARAARTRHIWTAKARTSLAGAARAGGPSANIGAGVGALLGSL